jgi:cytochrome c biogenesis protein
MAAPTSTRAIRRRRIVADKQRNVITLWGFDYHQPFDALWRLFSSIKMAIVSISTLVILGIIGMLIVQAPAEVVSSPSDYAAWLNVDARAQYGSLTDLMNWFQFFTVFRSWYFKAFIVILAINILIGGMLNRWPGIWQRFRHMQLRRADGFYDNSPVKVGLTVGSGSTDETGEALRAAFRRKGYRVEVAEDSNETTTYIYVHKHTWTVFATFIFHTCLIGIMLCAVLTGWSGFGRDSMAQRILPGGIYNYFQDLAGFSYDQPLPDGDEGVVYPMGTAHNIFYRAQQFVADFDPVRQQPVDFYTDLQLFQDGKLVASKRIRVNDPLTYQGVTFHQASFMMYTSIQLRDNHGSVIYSSSVPLLDHRTTTPDPNSGNVLQTNNAESVPLSNLGDTMNVVAANINGDWIIGLRGYDINQQAIFQGGAVFGKECINADGTPAQPGNYGCQLSNGWWVKVNDVRRGTVLLVTKDAGSPLLWPILVLLVFSLWVTFSMPPRRLWARIDGDQVRMAALKEHIVNMQRELDSFARSFGNIPLRSVQQAVDSVKPVTGQAKRKKVAAFTSSS